MRREICHVNGTAEAVLRGTRLNEIWQELLRLDTNEHMLEVYSLSLYVRWLLKRSNTIVENTLPASEISIMTTRSNSHHSEMTVPPCCRSVPKDPYSRYMTYPALKRIPPSAQP